MDSFKKLPKMQCFKEGGAVSNYKAGGKADCYKEGGKADMKQDVSTAKKVAKKAITLHDNQLHDGEKTDLSKLRKGGRAKKAGGNVRKYKAGGIIEDKKADAPSKGATKPAKSGLEALNIGGKGGDKDPIKKVAPKGDKVKKSPKADVEVKNFAGGGFTGTPTLTPEQRAAIGQSLFTPQMAQNPQQAPMGLATQQPQPQMPQPSPTQAGMVPRPMQPVLPQ